MASDLTVVTGPTGQIGLHLIDELLTRGKRVRALVLNGDGGLGNREVERVEGDVRDPASLLRALSGAAVVYHLAAVVSTDDSLGSALWSVNVDGARNTARVAREVGVRRFVHFSSIVVFDPTPLDRPLDERRRRLNGGVGSLYCRSKVAGEAAVLDEVNRGLHAVVVHPTVAVGPFETHHRGIVRNLIARQQFRKLPVLLNGGFNAVDVLDVVDGAMAAARQGRAGESYILGGHWHSVAEFCRLAEAVGVGPTPRVRLPLWMARAVLPAAKLGAKIAGNRPLFNAEEIRQLEGNRFICIDKAARELGYRPRPIRESLRRCRQWLTDEASRGDLL